MINPDNNKFLISNDGSDGGLVSDSSDHIGGGGLFMFGEQDLLSNFDSVEIHTSNAGISLIAATDELGQTRVLDPITFAENYPDDASVVADFLVKIAARDGHEIEGHGLVELNTSYAESLKVEFLEELEGLPPIEPPRM